MVDDINAQVSYLPPDSTPEAKSNSNKDFHLFGEDGFSFYDFLDVINPLQHIPVVSTAYRSLTGDELDPGARLAGGTLFGGPIGLAASAFNVILEHNTGKDTGEHVLAWFEGDEQSPESQPKFADGSNGFAPPVGLPASEAAAFAAGEASLRMAEQAEGPQTGAMSPEFQQQAVQQASLRQPLPSGSLGAWQPANNIAHPFPTQRLNEAPTQAVFQQEVTQAQATISSQPQSPAAAPLPPVESRTLFQAKQSHADSLDALRAFARDVKAQQAAGGTLDAQSEETRRLEAAARSQEGVPAPVPHSPAQLSQTDSSWFATLMSQNINRYSTQNGS